MNNYEFCADWVMRRAQPGARVLDYGCGKGQIVSLLRAENIKAFGCDVYYEGGDYAPDILDVAGPYVSRMHGSRIPFDDASFDIVISNQVLEHVPDLDTVTAEIARVLKPGGQVLHLFPSRGVWREGHTGIPFLHWFPKRSKWAVHYAATLRRLGLGYNVNGFSPRAWASGICHWVDNWCYYRSLPEIRSSFERHFDSMEHIEEHWLRARLRPLPFPAWLQRWLARKMAGIVVVLRKEHHGSVATTCMAPVGKRATI